MRRLEANGTTIAYARTGAGPPIALMHGAEADHSMFARLTARLEKRLTVIAYDQGDSGDTCNFGSSTRSRIWVTMLRR